MEIEPRDEPVRRRTDGQQTTNWYGERELTEQEIGTANGNDELRSSRSVLRGCLVRELVNGRRRRAVWREIDWPRGKECRETKFPGKKDDRLGILHNGWRSPDFSLAIFIWGFAIWLKCITSNA